MDQQNESDFFGSVFKIALGIFFGVMLLWMVGAWVVRYQLQQAAAAMHQVTHQAREQALARARKRDADAFADRFFAQQRQNEQRAVEVQARAQAQRKDQAWARFFQRSEECLRTSSIECGNQYIRARREFERRYATGELD